MFSRIDTTLFITTIVIVLSGLLFFGSAALGVLASNEAKFYGVIENQIIYAFLGGAVALFLGTIIPYQVYKKYAFFLFSVALFVTTLVFVPGLSVYHGGAHRWVDLRFITLQPSEFIKFGFVAATAFWCSQYRHLFKNWKYGLLPYMIGAGIVSVLLLLQPDFGTYTIIIVSSFVVYFVGGARKKHMLTLLGVAIVGFVVLLLSRPYMLERIKTFVNPDYDPHGASWQVKQSLIALGSGGITGRGLGQSVQKFNYLPEPIGDSIFAVIGEELGFIGVSYLIILYGIVGRRGYQISVYASDQFGRLLAIGITVIILTQAMINILSMLKLFPLTGVPLPLISHGGTALMVVLFQIGVLLNISKSSHYNLI